MARKKVNCKLPPYEVEEVLTLNEVRQKAGWNITAFNLPDAWDLTQGEGIKVAILDSGIDLDHPDLKDNILPGINLVEPNKPPRDDNNHKTHITNIIVLTSVLN